MKQSYRSFLGRENIKHDNLYPISEYKTNILKY